MLRVVLFDLDNTLVDRDRAFHECLCHHFDNPDVRAELLALDDGGNGNRKTLFAAWTKHANSPMDQRTFGGMIAERIQPDPLLLDALHALSQTVKLGIITNGGGETQRAKFHAAGLSRVISNEHLWISAEVGMTKPDPGLFLFAMRSLRHGPENCLYIGDHENDLAGAQAAGMRAQLIDAVLDADKLNELIANERLQ